MARITIGNSQIVPFHYMLPDIMLLQKRKNIMDLAISVVLVALFINI